MIEFRTKLVLGKKNPKSRIAWAGAIILIISVFVSLVHGYATYALWGFGISMVLLIGGAVYAKGDLADIEVSATDLVLNSGEIRIGDRAFPMDQVRDLVIRVKGYDGMVGRNLSSPTEGVLNGMDNFIQFTAPEGRQGFLFYLASAESIQQLGLLYREFYEKRIDFTESDGGYPTFLFTPMLTAAAVEKAKRDAGYL